MELWDALMVLSRGFGLGLLFAIGAILLMALALWLVRWIVGALRGASE